MLKQGINTINTELIQTCALSQISFLQFRSYATSFLGLLLSLMLMPKSTKTLQASLDLIPLLKTSVGARIEDLFSNVDYLENWCHNFIQMKYVRKKTSTVHARFVLWTVIFLFVQTFYTIDYS